MLVFQGGQLRFEGHPWLPAQNYSRNRAIVQNREWKAALQMQISPVQRLGICHRADSNAIRRKRRREKRGSKRSLVILVNRNFERRARMELRAARRWPSGSSQRLRPVYTTAGNSEQRKAAHMPVPRQGLRASPDSEPSAASSRFEYALLSASYDYATPAPSSRQPDRRPAFRRVNISIGVAVRVFVHRHFAGEGAIDVGKIPRGQNDSDDPPRQSDFQTIVTGFCRCHR